MSLLRQINLARLQSLQQLFRCNVDEFKINGRIEDSIRYRFANYDPRNLTDDVVQAFDMLNIQCRPDIDACFQQFLNILPAFLVTTANGIRMSQFVDK